MPKVKKIKLSGPFFKCKEPPQIINFNLALQEILFYNHPDKTKEDEDKIRRQLNEGFMINTPAHVYTLINPNQDFLNNIDDGVDLGAEGGFF